VHDNEKGLNRLLKAYRNHLSDITYKLYPGGRHEMLNETNSEEVTADIISWLQQTLDKKA
jgi:alpha-beta hydrolase superfamily lysophospholipase